VDQSRTDGDIDVIGVMAEVAVAKLLGLDYDRILAIGTDDGSDLVFNGITIDVKSSFYQTGRLMLRRELRSEVAVFVVPTREGNVMRVEDDDLFDHLRQRIHEGLHRNPVLLIPALCHHARCVVPRQGVEQHDAVLTGAAVPHHVDGQVHAAFGSDAGIQKENLRRINLCH